MKILDLELINIQSHPHSKIQFHPNLNVIRAQSDVGKSVIIRGLKFVITNRASKNIRRRRTETSEVILSDGESTVGRYKSDKINGYTVDDKGNVHSFKALGKDIPFESAKDLELELQTDISTYEITAYLIEYNDITYQVSEETYNAAQTLKN